MRARIFIRLLILWMAVLPLAYTAEVAPPTSPLNLLPWPKSVDVAQGAVAIGEQSRIVALNAELIANPKFYEALEEIIGEMCSAAPTASPLWLSRRGGLKRLPCNSEANPRNKERLRT